MKYYKVTQGVAKVFFNGTAIYCTKDEVFYGNKLFTPDGELDPSKVVSANPHSKIVTICQCEPTQAQLESFNEKLIFAIEARHHKLTLQDVHAAQDYLIARRLRATTINVGHLLGCSREMVSRVLNSN